MLAKVYNAFKILSAPLRRKFVFFVFMYILFVAVRLFEQTHSPVSAWVYCLENVFDLYVLCAVLCIFPRKVGRWLKILFYVIGYTVAVSECFIHERFHLVFVPMTMQLLCETNTQEAGEFFAAYLKSEALLKVAVVYIPILVLNIIGEIFRSRIKHFIDDNVNAIIMKVFDVVVPIFVTVCFILTIGEKATMLRFFMRSETMTAERVDTHTFHTPLYRMLYSAYFLKLSEGELDNMRKRMHDIHIDSCSHTIPNIILYIGESYNKHHSQLYGYALPTTPNQSALESKGSLVAFTDAVSPWNVTSNVFKNILSTHGTDQEGSWTDGVLIPAILKKAGYKVAFITSQYYKSPNMGVADFNGSFFLNDDELDSLCFDYRNKYRKRFDSNLIKEIDKFERGAYNFIIFHGIGQHQEYNKRFGEKNIRFTVDDYAHRTDLSKEEKQIIADYDNATRFNDLVFALLCKKFKEDTAVVVYLPDHGEEVFDRIHNFGRDHTAALTAEIAYSEFEVPFEIWFSPSVRRLYPDLVQDARNAADKPFASDDLPHVLMGLAGIRSELYDPRRDILNSAYNTARKRWLKQSVDYDSLMSAKK